MSKLTYGGDGAHWVDCWKIHRECRLMHFAKLLVKIKEEVDTKECLMRTPLTNELNRVVKDIKLYNEERIRDG